MLVPRLAPIPAFPRKQGKEVYRGDVGQRFEASRAHAVDVEGRARHPES